LLENTASLGPVEVAVRKNSYYFRAQVDGVGLSSQDEVIILSLKNIISHSLVTILSDECIINDNEEI
jgi:hypothetical protein